jgi:hypothetical protein
LNFILGKWGGRLATRVTQKLALTEQGTVRPQCYEALGEGRLALNQIDTTSARTLEPNANAIGGN